MHKAEIVFFGITIIFYSLTLFLRLFYLSRRAISQQYLDTRNEKRKDVAGTLWFLYLGFLTHLFTIALRWEFAGHPPIMGTYESALSGSYVTVFLLIIFQKKYPEIDIPQALALFLSIILMLYGLLFPTDYIPLTISEQSLWVDIHAFFAWLGYGGYVIAFGCAVEVTIDSFVKREVEVDNPSIIQDLMFYTFFIGFFFQTLMMGTGIYYNFILFGNWWRWDPIELLALISWLISGLVIHTKLFYEWKGKKLATLVIISFLFVIILYKVFPFLPRGSTFHNFDLTF